MAHQSTFQERLRIALPLRDNVVLVALVRLVQTQPHAAEVELFHDALADVLPLRMRAARADRAERRPVRVVEQDLESRLLVQPA